MTFEKKRPNKCLKKCKYLLFMFINLLIMHVLNIIQTCEKSNEEFKLFYKNVFSKSKIKLLFHSYS